MSNVKSSVVHFTLCIVHWLSRFVCSIRCNGTEARIRFIDLSVCVGNHICVIICIHNFNVASCLLNDEYFLAFVKCCTCLGGWAAVYVKQHLGDAIYNTIRMCWTKKFISMDFTKSTASYEHDWNYLLFISPKLLITFTNSTWTIRWKTRIFNFVDSFIYQDPTIRDSCVGTYWLLIRLHRRIISHSVSVFSTSRWISLVFLAPQGAYSDSVADKHEIKSKQIIINNIFYALFGKKCDVVDRFCVCFFFFCW